MRIVRAHGRGADEDGIVDVAQSVRSPSRGRPGDPARVATARGDPAVERRRELERHDRPAARTSDR
jgi:hypothetical protein